jgi:hypothetical protein
MGAAAADPGCLLMLLAVASVLLPLQGIYGFRGAKTQLLSQVRYALFCLLD